MLVANFKGFGGEKMNKFVKKLMALGLSVGMIAGVGFGFAGCGDSGKDIDPDKPPIVDPSYDPDKDKDPDIQDPTKDPDKEPDVQNPDKNPDKEPDEPVTPPVTEKKTLAEAEAEFDAFVQKFTTGKNFTYTLERPLQKITAEFAGDKLKYDSNNEVTYLSDENGENFVYELKEDNVWHKNFAEEDTTIDHVLSTVTDALEDVTWKSFDDSSNLLLGEVTTTSQGAPALTQIEANFDQDDMSVKMKSGLTTTNMAVSKVGTTTVTLPANVKDDTVQNENIFKTENGETVWNVKAIKDVLEPWLKNEMTDASGNHVDNQFGRPVFARVNDNKVREIIFVNPAKDKLEFGYILDNPEGNSFEARHIWGWDDFSANKQSLTKDEFTQFLITREERDLLSTISKIDLEYTTLDQDYATAHKQEFETLTKNVFEKYHKEKDASDPSYNGAEILFAFKTPMGPTNLGDDGYGRSWGQYYLMRQNGNISLIKVDGVRGLVAGDGPLQNVLQNQEGKWKIGYGVNNLADISKENNTLFSKPIMTIGTNAKLSKE